MLSKKILMIALFFIVFAYSVENNYPQSLENPKSKQDIAIRRENQMDFISNRIEILKDHQSDIVQSIFHAYNHNIVPDNNVPQIDQINHVNFTIYKILISPPTEILYFLHNHTEIIDSFTIWNQHVIYHHLEGDPPMGPDTTWHTTDLQSYPISIHFEKRLVKYSFQFNGAITTNVVNWSESAVAIHPHKDWNKPGYWIKVDNTKYIFKYYFYIGINNVITFHLNLYFNNGINSVITFQDIMDYPPFKKKREEKIHYMKYLSNTKLKNIDYNLKRKRE